MFLVNRQALLQAGSLSVLKGMCIVSKLRVIAARSLMTAASAEEIRVHTVSCFYQCCITILSALSGECLLISKQSC